MKLEITKVFGGIAALTLLGFSAMAQDEPLSLNSQIQSFGMVGLANGQSAQLNVLNPGVPAPFLGVICTARLSFVDDQNSELKGSEVLRILPGKSVSLTLTKSTEIATDHARVQIRGVVRTPPTFSASDGEVPPPTAYCPLVTTLEIFDADSGQTRVILTDPRIVFPLPQPTHNTQLGRG